MDNYLNKNFTLPTIILSPFVDELTQTVGKFAIAVCQLGDPVALPSDVGEFYSFFY